MFISSDMTALQGTRLASSGTIKEDHYSFFLFGKPADQLHLCGIGFVMSSETTSSAAWSRLQLLATAYQCQSQSSIRVLSAYTSTLAADSAHMDTFYQQLEKILRDSGSNERIILLGYLNARIGNYH